MLHSGLKRVVVATRGRMKMTVIYLLHADFFYVFFLSVDLFSKSKTNLSGIPVECQMAWI